MRTVGMLHINWSVHMLVHTKSSLVHFNLVLFETTLLPTCTRKHYKKVTHYSIDD